MISLGAWERLDDMPGACGGCSAAATADGLVHITGGETFRAESGGRLTYRDHYIYDPATESWRVGAPMPTARHGIGAAAVGDRFYVVGGGLIAGLDYTTTVEWWEPLYPGPSPEPSATSDAPGETPAPPIEGSPAAELFVPAAER